MSDTIIKEAEVIDIADFFTKSNEEEGTWFEPVVFGKPLGLEFKVLGANSDKVSVINEQFNKKRAEIAVIEDLSKKAKKTAELYAKSAAERVVGIRTKEGKKVCIGGKPIENTEATVFQIFSNSYDIASAVIRFSMDSENFMNKKID